MGVGLLLEYTCHCCHRCCHSCPFHSPSHTCSHTSSHTVRTRFITGLTCMPKADDKDAGGESSFKARLCEFARRNVDLVSGGRLCDMRGVRSEL